jgi:hypothetical protein
METGTSFSKREDVRIICFRQRDLCPTDGVTLLNDSYEHPFLPGKYFKILVPADTMTLDKFPLFNYGLTDLESFLDNSIHKPSSLKRTINPKESSGFYIVMLSLRVEGAQGSMLRTGLSLKGQDLFYRIS